MYGAWSQGMRYAARATTTTRSHAMATRPLLEGSDDVEATLTKLMEERDPLYRSIADLTVKTGDQPARRLAREIVERLESIGTAEI